MREVVLFPENKLNISVCEFYNNHYGAATQETDQLRRGNYEVPEMELFRHNIQGTAFIDSEYAVQAGSAYRNKLLKVSKTGRISFGLYYLNQRWYDETLDKTTTIPDYNYSTWTDWGASYFSGITEGDPKPTRYPNHGQEMYDVSNGEYGYDYINDVFGQSNCLETFQHSINQFGYYSDMGLILSGASYSLGQTGGKELYKISNLGIRNSEYSFSGDSDIGYNIPPDDFKSKASSTRTYDSYSGGDLPTAAASLAYSATQVERVYVEGGWYNDFIHWHQMYRDNEMDFFNQMFGMMDSAIGSNDVWRAGYGEVLEYSSLKRSVKNLGSFIDGDSIQLFVQLDDPEKDSATFGVSNAINFELVNTPLSFKVNLAGTPLSSKNISCDSAALIRDLGNDEWVVNVLPSRFRNGYFNFKVYESASSEYYYSSERPTLTFSNNEVTTNTPCMFVVWRKPVGGDEYDIEEVSRSADYTDAYEINVESGYNYYVGGLTASRVSNLLEVN